MCVPEHGEALTVGHALVGDHYIEVVGGESAAGFLYPRRFPDFMLILPQVESENPAHAGFVVDKQNSSHGSFSQRCPWSGARGRVMEKRTQDAPFSANLRSPPCARAMLRAIARPSRFRGV